MVASMITLLISVLVPVCMIGIVVYGVVVGWRDYKNSQNHVQNGHTTQLRGCYDNCWNYLCCM